MTSLDARPASAVASTAAVTPTLGAFLRQSRFWIGVGVFALIGGIVILLVRGGAAAGDTSALSATSPAPGGSKAVVEVLRQQGVTVQTADSLADARAKAGAQSTVLFFDPNAYLSDSQLADVSDLGARLVLVTPDFAELDALAPGVAAAGAPDDSGPLSADCDLPAARSAASITASGQTYRSVGDASAISCFTSYGDAYSVIQSGEAEHPVTILGAPDVLTNGHIAEAGNAALALGLLGESDSLVWYIPTAADYVTTGPPSLADLTPGWVTPLIGLLAAVFVAAAVWRGRRLGPVVVENLPVIVRGNETVTGRARLYARSGARTRAVDALRVGALTRMGGTLGLPRTAGVDEIVSAASAVTGIPAIEVAEVLITTLPSNEAQLIDLSNRLGRLETAVQVAVHGSGAAPRTPPPPSAQAGSPQSRSAPSRSAPSRSVPSPSTPSLSSPPSPPSPSRRKPKS